jgi:hypothetical protein
VPLGQLNRLAFAQVVAAGPKRNFALHNGFV